MNVMDRAGIEEHEPIEHSLVSKSLETAQKRVETHNLEIRKQLLKYDDVMNKQREIIYAERQKAFAEEDLKEHVGDLIDDVLDEAIDEYAPPGTYPDVWNLGGLTNWARRHFGVHPAFDELDSEAVESEDILENLREAVHRAYEDKERRLGSEIMREVEQVALVRAVDAKWKDHLYAMDLLKEGIGLRAFGQKDPLIEYKNEGFNLFSEMIADVKMATVEFLFRVQVGEPERIQESAPAPARSMVSSHDAPGGSFGGTPQSAPQASGPPDAPDASTQGPAKVPVRVGPKVGRNDPCPCNSGKKYKKCCGQ